MSEDPLTIFDNATAQLFTASAIARALGCSRQNVHQRLNGTPEDGRQFANGNQAKAWHIESLPAGIIRQLSEKAETKHYRTVVDLLREPFVRYQPTIPLAEIAPAGLDRAQKLRAALLDIMPRRNDSNISATELADYGVEAYKREYGYEITPRHWRTLFDRTIERDNGAEEWSRLEIYVDENPPRISSRLPISAARERHLEILEDALTSIAGVTALSIEQKVLLWTKACDELQIQIENRAHEKKTKGAIVKVLLTSGLLGADKETIRRNLNRQWAAYQKNNGRLIDRRTIRDQRKRLPDGDINKLRARTLDCGGRVSQAFRECRDNGELSPETLDGTIANPHSKSYVPTATRRAAGNRHQIKPLLTLHRSERNFELSSAHNTRDYSGLFPGDSYQADDCTCPVYYWEPDLSNSHGYRIIRGQLIMMIDERTLLGLGYALHSERNYNARVIRALITRVHDQWGLPRRRFYFERGIWRDAKILTGERSAASGFDVPIEQTEMGLREFGIMFVHAKYPRGKVIERVLGIVQNEMERLPGYVGRNERDDRYDRVQQKINQANAGHIHPSDFLMSRDEWLSKLCNLIHKCNAERRSGRILKGMSSLEVWNSLQPPEGQVHLGDKARVILAEHRLKMRVQRNGITLRPSLGGGTYCGEATGQLRGKDVLVWVNPENLDSIGITSLDRKEGPFVVPRLEPLPAIDCTPEQFAASAEQINSHNQPTRTVYRLVSPHLAAHNFRPLAFVDRRTSEIGRSLEEQKTALTNERRKNTRLIRKAQQTGRELGLQIPLQANALDRTAEGIDLMAESRRLRTSEESAQ